jgi:hypothetical protein
LNQGNQLTCGQLLERNRANVIHVPSFD